MTGSARKDAMAARLMNVLQSTFAITVMRVVTGLVFIISGLSKGIDPWGFIFKIEDYLSVWGLDIPRPIVLTGAIALSAYEFVLGVMIAIGAYKRLAPRLLLLTMVFMLPLTLYIAIANPVNDCGCFGDFLRLSNAVTFIKNMILTAMLIWLIKYNVKAEWALVKKPFQFLSLSVCTIYLLVVALLGYFVQPLADFRDFPIGTTLLSNVQQVDEPLYTYSKGNETLAFKPDALPDSTWTFIGRAAPSKSDDITELAVFDSFGDDVTEEVLGSGSTLLLITIPEPSETDVAYSYAANEIAEAATHSGYNVVALIGGGQDAVENWQDISMSVYPCYLSDDSALKNLVRGTLGLVAVDTAGKIEWKRSLPSVDFETLESLEAQTAEIGTLAPQKGLLCTLTLSLAAILGITAVISHLFLKRKRRNEKKDVNLQEEKTNH